MDAHTGIILDNIENTHNCSETCNSKQVNIPTIYAGEANVDLCCDANNCYLDSEIGGGITVYDANECYCSPLNCIKDENGYFTDTIANEVYAATHQYYQFLLDVFNRKSIDDEDHPLIAFIHYGINENNAYWWNGSSYFGDGDKVYANSFTTMDIIGHEFTHGMILHTANLNYAYESGALNESFADIFGLLLEDYVNGETDWKIGNDFMLQYSAIRNIANPNDPTLKRQYPNTYLGQNYYTGDGDNGGVHINSSIQNYWFYLLSEGGSGVNDNGYAYNIEPIGIDATAEIAYQNLTNYLTPTSQFADARDGAIKAAKVIFGEDSFEAEQTELAWCAVGVGACGFKPTCDRLTDSLALVAFYNSTNGDNWDINVQWDFTKPMDTWQGVTLNENGCVKKLSIYWSNLTGTIPPEIGNLSSLEELTLAETPIGGEISKEIEQLTNLKKLTLVNLELTGSIPAEIGNLTQLESLTIKFNNLLSGPIPNEIGQLNNLKVLELSGIDLSGEIPNEIYSMINLEVLILGGLSSINPEPGLTGSISKEMGNLVNLKTLSLSSNKLTGIIPDEIGNLLQLERLDLWGNNLEGSIPKTIERLKNLKSINLSWNKLTESIPIEIAQLDSLTSLALDHNQLTGAIPAVLCELENLTLLILSFNQLTGCYPECFSQICNQLEKIDDFGISDGNNFNATFEEFCLNGAGSCPPALPCDAVADSLNLVTVFNDTGGENWTGPWDFNLPMWTWGGVFRNEEGCVTKLNLWSKNLTGPLPESLFDFPHLEILVLGQMPDLGGEIPTEIDKLTNLKELYLGNIGLTGNIPVELFTLENLEKLSLPNNFLEGSIPSEIEQLSNLKALDLTANYLSGGLPMELFNMTQLEELRLSGLNWLDSTFGLTGTIPSEISNLINLKVLDIGSNRFTGIIPTEIGQLVNLTHLKIGGELSGAIPAELGQLVNLMELTLGSGLDDTIPPEIGLLINLRVLALGYNNLSGTIPPELGQLTNLEGLFLSSNQLSGNLPDEMGELFNLKNLWLSSNQFTGCYPSSMHKLCDSLINPFSYNISDGNNFDATWEEFCATGAGECPQVACDDRQILIEIYNALGGPDSDLNWDFTQPIDTWQGVTVNEYDCVTQLNLNGKNLNGFISPNLSTNSIFGEIPAEIGNLTKLKQILLNDNGLSGEIPPSIGNLVLLEKLWLYSNQLTGSIPAEIGNLTLLKRKNIEKNQLTGSIPPEIGNLKELTGLVLASNMLTGEIPIEIGNLTKLGWLQINSNELNGEIPASIGYLSQLTHIYLEDNLLTGGIPAELCNLSKLEVIRPNHNQLSGCYPECLQIFCDIDAAVLGSGFNATWEEFCATGAGTCIDTFVLPGDFNNDGCLSYLDVLFWGLAEGKTEPVRTMPTNNFVQQPAEDWDALVNGVNGKHQDANGDGVVNLLDLYVFVDNYKEQENRCSENEAGRTNDFLNFLRIKEVDNQKIEGTNKRQKTYEIYVESKIENQKVSLHGLALGLTFKGLSKIHNIELDASNFDAKVDTVTSLEGNTFRFAITRTDNGSSIFGVDIPAAILIVTIEDIPSTEERTVEEIISSGSMIDPGSGIHPMSLQGATTILVSENETEENDYTIDVVPSPSKELAYLYVNTEAGVDIFTVPLKPSAEPCEGTISIERIDDCTDKISDGCSINEVVDKCPVFIPKIPVSSFDVRPNPAIRFTQLTLKAEHCNRQINKIEIFDVTGFLVQTVQANKQGNSIYQIDANDLPTGIYFINMMSGDHLLNGKFMKQ